MNPDFTVPLRQQQGDASIAYTFAEITWRCVMLTAACDLVTSLIVIRIVDPVYTCMKPKDNLNFR